MMLTTTKRSSTIMGRLCRWLWLLMLLTTTTTTTLVHGYCYICGDEYQVGNGNGIVTIDGYGTLTCDELQTQARELEGQECNTVVTYIRTQTTACACERATNIFTIIQNFILSFFTGIFDFFTGLFGG